MLMPRLLATNMLIWPDIKPGLKFGVSILPIGLMFAAFVPIFAIAKWTAAALDLGTGPVAAQSNGLLWLVLFLTFMVALMLAGYALGWLLNAALARVIFRWPADKVRNVFLESRVPTEWRRADTLAAAPGGTPVRKRGAWVAMRTKGRWHFVLVRGVLGWGGAMFFAMGLMPVLSHRREPSWPYFFSQAIIWTIGGALFGLAVWTWSERQFRKQSPSDES
jgi:hypothetical protein